MWNKENSVKIEQEESWFEQDTISEEGRPEWKGCFVYASCDDETQKNQWEHILAQNPGDNKGCVLWVILMIAWRARINRRKHSE
ncbi:hypothetical protein LIER_34630 [Lithospermum erythrorhizon]|uniref:Uncharacterized protein n=1 Tax=Lithospermum erythrorhizon TaxID=34254 RepID=A0AAV3S1G2_LITER